MGRSVVVEVVSRIVVDVQYIEFGTVIVPVIMSALNASTAVMIEGSNVSRSVLTS